VRTGELLLQVDVFSLQPLLKLPDLSRALGDLELEFVTGLFQGGFLQVALLLQAFAGGMKFFQDLRTPQGRRQARCRRGGSAGRCVAGGTIA